MKQINHTTAKVYNLSSVQREHLAWRLIHRTTCGAIVASRIARGEGADRTLIDIFEWMGRSHRSASMQAKKVWEFEVKNDIR